MSAEVAAAQGVVRTLALTREERAYLNEKRRLTFCVDPDWLPIEGVDDQGWVDNALKFTAQGGVTLTLEPAKGLLRSCGLIVVDLDSGQVAHWLRFEGVITELYDLQVLPGVRRPLALGFQADTIATRLFLEPDHAG